MFKYNKEDVNKLVGDEENVDEIVEELKNNTTTSERSGRAQDQEDTYAMQKLRARGYM